MIIKHQSFSSISGKKFIKKRKLKLHVKSYLQKINKCVLWLRKELTQVVTSLEFVAHWVRSKSVTVNLVKNMFKDLRVKISIQDIGAPIYYFFRKIPLVMFPVVKLSLHKSTTGF